VPPLLSWLGGEPVTLTGEETARLRTGTQREVRGEGYVSPRDWSEEIKSRMRTMRESGSTPREILKKYA
jgi:hypothetical protein